jgi:anthranilate phosphoribosyltransferase
MSALAEAIKKVATGPHLSKDLSLEEAYEAAMEAMSPEADVVRAAIFFIALRMKRETHEENMGILKAMQAVTEQVEVNVPSLMVFADPFNGFNRHCPVSVFIPAVLAACGQAALSQGVFEMGPKWGVTHAQVLKLAGYGLTQSVTDAANQVENTDVGWAYLDQAVASPRVFGLQELRTKIIKRPSLATLEKMLLPLKATTNHLSIGFVHKEYPPLLAQLAIDFGFDTATIVRGLEGGIIPTLREGSQNYRVENGEMIDWPLDPKDFGIEQTTRGVKVDDVTAELTLELGMAALNGQAGPAYDSLVLGAAMMLCQTNKALSFNEAAQKIRTVLDNGKAKQHFQNGMQ